MAPTSSPLCRLNRKKKKIIIIKEIIQKQTNKINMGTRGNPIPIPPPIIMAE